MNNDVRVMSVLLGLAVLLLSCCEAGFAEDDPNFTAINPNPADGQTHVWVEPNLTLSWDIVDVNTEGYTIEYDVYYGTDQNEIETSTIPDVNGIETNSHTLSRLEHDTEYFWRIDTRQTYWDPGGLPFPIATFRIIKGSVWSFTTGPGPPRVITVDDDVAADFNNIQAAIDDSNDGDTVLVADGTYTGDGNRDIDFHGKAITVKSENGPATCIVDCNGTEAEPHRGFHFHSGEDANSAIIGFTITKGYAEIGGGIVCDNASPSIVDCVITLNTAYLDDGWEREGGQGGGICCDKASPSIIDCVITHNVAYEWYGGGYGGGIYCDDSNALITGCRLSNNEARCRPAEILVGGCGGGIYIEGGNTNVTKCVLENNSKGVGWSGPIHCRGGFSTITGCEISENEDNNNWAVGMWLEYCRAVIRNCTVRGNASAGIVCDDVSDGRISGCTIIGNFGSGISAKASDLTISSCMIAENFRCGIASTRRSTLEIRYSTVAWNGTGGRYGHYTHCRAVDCGVECSSTIIGSILWGMHTEPSPVPSDYPSLYCRDAEVQYSCIYGWDGASGGVGNIVEYPMFADPGYWNPCNTPEYYADDIWVRGDYHLKSQGGRWDPNEGRWTMDDVTSPCVDAGDPLDPVGHEPFPNGGIINMGVYGGTDEASKSYFGKPACETIVAGDVNGDCEIDFEDFRLMALHWCEEWLE